MAREAREPSQVLAMPAANWTEEAIVAGLRRGDPEAAAALYDRVQDRVNRIVWRMLGADAEHDDVMHQVFVEALDSASALRNPGSLESWMVGITLNTVRRELRRRRFRRRLFGPEAPEPVDADGTLDPERLMLLRRFYGALEHLGASERILFTLRFVEGYSLAEAAEAAGCSLAAVKRRLERARRAFAARAARDPVLAAWIGSNGHAD
jgi:RNA polymerase sigma-70 factor (ECF subfamily)